MARKYPETSLVFLISDMFGIEVDSEDFSILFDQTLSYLTDGVTAFEYQHTIKPFCLGTQHSAKVFRLQLHATRYVALKLKLYVYTLGSERSACADRAKAIAKSLGISNCDALRIFKCWNANQKFRARIKRYVSALSKTGALVSEVLTEHYLDNWFSLNIYSKVYSYIKFITYSKLRFIAKSSNVEFCDLHNDLLYKVTQSYYSVVPTLMVEAHVVNYLKRAAHNHAMNMIKAETTQKRGRLVNSGRDRENNRLFTLQVVSENQRMPNADGETSSYEEVDIGVTEKFDLQISVNQILTSLDRRSKKYRLLTILMGTEDAGFTEWLRARNHCSPLHDCCDVQDRLPARAFNALLSDFLNVSEDRVNVFLFKVKHALALNDTAPTLLAA